MNQRHRQAGFTLIELVASAVLASMMMVAIFGIVWSTLQETQQLPPESMHKVITGSYLPPYRVGRGSIL